MDLTALHANIKQYTHVVDTIGRMDYHPGKVCLYGTNDLQQNPQVTRQFSHVKAFCGRLVGYDGSVLFEGGEDVEQSFAQCNPKLRMNDVGFRNYKYY
jgi:hypothetical protein